MSETWTESWSHGCTDGVIEQGMHRRSHGVMDAQTESWSEASKGRSHGVSETWTESWSHGCTDGVME